MKMLTSEEITAHKTALRDGNGKVVVTAYGRTITTPEELDAAVVAEAARREADVRRADSGVTVETAIDHLSSLQQLLLAKAEGDSLQAAHETTQADLADLQAKYAQLESAHQALQAVAASGGKTPSDASGDSSDKTDSATKTGATRAGRKNPDTRPETPDAPSDTTDNDRTTAPQPDVPGQTIATQGAQAAPSLDPQLTAQTA